MSEVKFPDPPFRPEELADWLELCAIQAGTASAGELEREFNRLEHGDAHDLLGNTLEEVSRRERAVGQALIHSNGRIPPLNSRVRRRAIPLMFFAWPFRTLSGRRVAEHQKIRGCSLKNSHVFRLKDT
jgi:hypothetical protein